MYGIKHHDAAKVLLSEMLVDTLELLQQDVLPYIKDIKVVQCNVADCT